MQFLHTLESFFELSQIDYLFRLIVSILCGGAIGFERTKRLKEAGIRTHIIVALGSALIMLVSKYGFFDIIIYEGLSTDASRIAASVVSGISFLGAGVIFMKNDYVKGLTTAAGIWATSGVGLAVGAGMYVIGIAATLLIVVIQLFLHHHLTSEYNSITKITCIVKNEETAFSSILEEMKTYNLLIQRFQIDRTGNDTLTIKMLVRTSQEMDPSKLFVLLQTNSYIQSISM